MVDVYTDDLLTLAEEALRPPEHLPPQQLDAWHAHTLRNRLPLIREALRIAREERDSELATQLIDQAMHDHPSITRPVSMTAPSRKSPWSASSAPTAPPRPFSPGERPLNPADDELLIPEHVLCTLIYKRWCMTVVGVPPHETYMAYRPFGWSGEGDPLERITAPTRNELLRLLCYRFLGLHNPDAPNPPHT